MKSNRLYSFYVAGVVAASAAAATAMMDPQDELNDKARAAAHAVFNYRFEQGQLNFDDPMMMEQYREGVGITEDETLEIHVFVVPKRTGGAGFGSFAEAIVRSNKISGQGYYRVSLGK